MVKKESLKISALRVLVSPALPEFSYFNFHILLLVQIFISSIDQILTYI